MTMPKKRPPDRPPIDWAAFIEARRDHEWNRQHNRPSQMIERHACKEWDSAAGRVRYYRDRITGKIPSR